MKRPIAILVLLFVATLLLWASTTGPNQATTFGDTNQWITTAVTDYDTSDDTRGDTVDCFDGDIDKLTGFGFAIPDGETIDGIQVDIEAKRDTGAARSRQVAATLLKAGAVAGDTKNTANITTTDVTYNLGGVADDWNATMSESDVENSGFGVQIVGSASQSTSSCEVDLVEITITSSAASTRNRFVEWGKVQHTQTRRATRVER